MSNHRPDKNRTPALEELTGALRTAVAEIRNEPVSEPVLRRVLERGRLLETDHLFPEHRWGLEADLRAEKDLPASDSTSASDPNRQRRLWRTMRCSRRLAWSGFLGVAASVAAMLVCAILVSKPGSVFADAIQQLKEAKAVHIRETFHDPEKLPGEMREAERWFLRNLGSASIFKTNGAVTRRAVDRGGLVKCWEASENEVVVRPSNTDYASLDHLWLTDPDHLLTYEQKAREQGKPIKLSELKKNGKDVRHIELLNVRIAGEGEEDQPGVILKRLVADIEKSSNRIVFLLTEERCVDGTLPDGNWIRHANGNPIHEFVIDYPAADSLDRSLFDLTYPADANIRNE